MNQISIEQSTEAPAPQLAVEIVERKGLGHPDTICDRVAEEISRRLCRAYMEGFGRLLHYNCDKSLLVAGAVEHRFGGGRVVEPMRLFLGDRASFGTAEKTVDVAGIAEDAARSWFRDNLRHVDPQRHLEIEIELKKGSEALTGLFADGGRNAPFAANDTSAAVGYAPLSETESTTLWIERYLNSEQYKRRFRQTGEDVKVMCVRVGRRLDVTVAMPLLDRDVASEKAYFEIKREIETDLRTRLEARLRGVDELRVGVNRLDRPAAGVQGVYLSVLGTSAESADSGQVGRGNHTNGIISLRRPGGAEAAAGKNPVSHVGKIYNHLAHHMADRLHREVPGLTEVAVWLCSRIGDPVDRPQATAVQLKLEAGASLQELAKPVRQIVVRELEGIPGFCAALTESGGPE